MDTASLASDALRHVLGLLEWRDLCSCALVCTSWHALAAENALWQKHISQEYYRPSLLAYSVSCLPSGWQQQKTGSSTTVAGAAAAAAAACSVISQKDNVLPAHDADSGCSTAVCLFQQQQPEAIGTQDDQVNPAAHTPGLAKSLFSAGLLHAAAPHQAQLARFHAALSQITGWRLVLKATAAAETPTARTAAAEDADFADLFARYPTPPAAAGAAAGPSNRAAAAGGAAGPSEIAAAQPQAQAHLSAATRPAAAAAAATSQEPVIGHPAPLSLQALQSAGGWAVGCVMMQQQEQSCWVRFNLPHELKTDSEVQQALQARHVTAVVQGLGSSGWFDVATAEEFVLSDHDMEILMQSHQTGFYAWDQAEEGGVDRYGQLTPLPWDLAPGQQQTHSQESQRQEHQQQHSTTVDRAGQAQQAGVQQQIGQASAVELVTQQLQQRGLQQQEDTATDAEQPPQLRMLVYVHYQQLLQVLPWALPQTLLLPARPVLDPPVEFAKHLLSGPCALWLQLDVCQLHGGYRLGSCIAPLVLWDWDSAKAKFRCIEEELTVVLYKPDRSINSTEGLEGAVDASAAEHRSIRQQAQHNTGIGTPSAAALAAPGSTVAAHPNQASAGHKSSWLRSVLCDQDAFQRVLVGSQCVYGANSSSSSSSSRDGSVLRTAAAALQELMGTDEIMVDFALFDAAGHLLAGRAGVEVWSKQATDAGCIMQDAVQQAVSGIDSVHTQQGLGASQQTVQSSGCSTLGSSGQRQPAQGPWQDKVNPLASCLRSPEVSPELLQTLRCCLLSVPEHAQEALISQETLLLEEAAMAEERDAAQAQQESLLPAIEYARTQHKLHFLVDGVKKAFFWDTCIVVDAEPPPAGFVRFGKALRPISRLSLSLAWSSLRALFCLPPDALPVD